MCDTRESRASHRKAGALWPSRQEKRRCPRFPLASSRHCQVRARVPCEIRPRFLKILFHGQALSNTAPNDCPSTVRVLVVEDYAPFLQCIASILGGTTTCRSLGKLLCGVNPLLNCKETATRAAVLQCLAVLHPVSRKLCHSSILAAGYRHRGNFRRLRRLPFGKGFRRIPSYLSDFCHFLHKSAKYGLVFI